MLIVVPMRTGHCIQFHVPLRHVHIHHLIVDKSLNLPTLIVRNYYYHLWKNHVFVYYHHRNHYYRHLVAPDKTPPNPDILRALFKKSSIPVGDVGDVVVAVVAAVATGRCCCCCVALDFFLLGDVRLPPAPGPSNRGGNLGLLLLLVLLLLLLFGLLGSRSYTTIGLGRRRFCCCCCCCCC